MIRKLLLLKLMLGAAAVAGANEARAVAVLDVACPAAHTAPDPQFTPIDFKRHGLHRGSGRIHKRFRPGGVSVKKRFVGPRSFAGKRLRDGGVMVRKRAVRPRLFFGKRFGAGVVVRKGAVGPRLFLGKRFGGGGIIVSKGFVGKRPGVRPFSADRPFHRTRR